MCFLLACFLFLWDRTSLLSSCGRPETYCVDCADLSFFLSFLIYPTWFDPIHLPIPLYLRSAPDIPPNKTKFKKEKEKKKKGNLQYDTASHVVNPLLICLYLQVFVAKLLVWFRSLVSTTLLMLNPHWDASWVSHNTRTMLVLNSLKPFCFWLKRAKLKASTTIPIGLWILWKSQ